MERQATHWIDGEWLETGTPRESIDPATGQAFASYFDGGLDEAKRAVAAARRTFLETDWKVDPMKRASALSHLADAYEQRTQDIIDCLSTENGKPKVEAGFETMQIVRALRFASGLALHTFGRVSEPRPGTQSMVLRQPVGVTGHGGNPGPFGFPFRAKFVQYDIINADNSLSASPAGAFDGPKLMSRLPNTNAVSAP